MRERNRSRVLGLGLSLLVAATGCLGRSPDVDQYVLGVEPLAPLETGAPNVSVLIGPVRLPAYLERDELARLESSGRVGLDSQNRWLGSFETNFLRALGLGVARRLGSTQVVTAPSRAPFPIEYTVRLHVDDLIAEAGGAMRVRIRWALIGPVGRGTEPPSGLVPRLFTFEERRGGIGASAAARVRAHESVLGELATRIAAEIVAAEQGGAVEGEAESKTGTRTEFEVQPGADSGSGSWSDEPGADEPAADASPSPATEAKPAP